MYMGMLLVNCIIYLTINVVCENDDGNVLQLVHVFFRHGSRTPTKSATYPTDPLAVDEFQPLGYAQLTNVGKRRSYQLGKLLRERYDSFLGDTYSPEMTFTKSTDRDRTKMSALMVLAGLFPPRGQQIWNTELNWMLVPYDYEKFSTDYELIRPSVYCPKLRREQQIAFQSDSAEKTLDDYQEDFVYMSQQTGKFLRTLPDAYSLYQTLYSEDKMNLTLPDWTNAIYPDTLHYLAVQFLYYETSNDISRRLNGGRMLKKVLQNIADKSEGILEPEGRKIFLYSGHEANVVAMLSVLDLFDMKFPDYSSAVMIELYCSNGSEKYTVKVMYARDVYKQPEELIVPGCTTFCPLGQFKEIVGCLLPNNYTEECESSVLLD